MQIALRNSSLLAFIVVLSSCSNTAMFDEFKPTKNGWHADSIVHFDVPVADTSAEYFVSMRVRHNADYPFENIFLFRTISSASGIEYQDTVDLMLADQSGKWLGDGVGEVKTMAWGYGRGALRFKTIGKYTFTLQQGMRDTILDGVMDVGLRIERIEEREK